TGERHRCPHSWCPPGNPHGHPFTEGKWGSGLAGRAGGREPGHWAGSSLAPPGLAVEPGAQELLSGAFLPRAAVDPGEALSQNEPPDQRISPVVRARIGPEDRRVNDHAVPAAGPKAQRRVHDPGLSVDEGFETVGLRRMRHGDDDEVGGHWPDPPPSILLEL